MLWQAWDKEEAIELITDEKKANEK